MSDEAILSLYLLFLFNSKLRQLIVNTSNVESKYICYSAPIKSATKVTTTTTTKLKTESTQTPQRYYNIRHQSSSFHSVGGYSDEYQSMSSSKNCKLSNEKSSSTKNGLIDSTNMIVQNISPKPSKKFDDDASKKYIANKSVTDSLIFGRRQVRAKTDSISLDNHQIKLLKVITKHTLLSGFAILFNQTFFVVDCISLEPDYESSWYYSQIVYA
eukprot:157634_1